MHRFIIEAVECSLCINKLDKENCNYTYRKEQEKHTRKNLLGMHLVQEAQERQSGEVEYFVLLVVQLHGPKGDDICICTGRTIITFLDIV